MCKHSMYSDESTCSLCSPVALPKKEHVGFSDYDRCASGWCDDATLEYLRNCAVISAAVPPHAADVFESEMDNFGVDFEYGHYVCYLKRAVDREDKRWYSAKVEFPHNDDLEFHKNINVLDSKGKKSINSIAFVGYLFANGFKFGPNKEIS